MRAAKRAQGEVEPATRCRRSDELYATLMKILATERVVGEAGDVAARDRARGAGRCARAIAGRSRSTPRSARRAPWPTCKRGRRPCIRRRRARTSSGRDRRAARDAGRQACTSSGPKAPGATATTAPTTPRRMRRSCRRLSGEPVRVQWIARRRARLGAEGRRDGDGVAGGVDANGKIVGWDYDVWTPTHRAARRAAAARRASSPVQLIGGAADVRAASLRRRAQRAAHVRDAERRVSSRICSSAPLRTSSLRGLGSPQNTFANESFMDELAGGGRGSGRVPAAASHGPARDRRGEAVAKLGKVGATCERFERTLVSATVRRTAAE